jgi:hypothetical protein
VIAPGAAHAALADILQSGERVIWTGRPDPVATFRTQLFWWWIGVPLMAVALGLRHFDIPADVHFFATIIALVFLAAPFLMVAFAYGTLYAITDRRVLIKHDMILKRPQLVSYNLSALDKEFEILEGRGNVGHLYFASGARSRVAMADYTGKVAFRELRDPHRVAAILDKARQDAIGTRRP